jgi:hypothetical protein
MSNTNLKTLLHQYLAEFQTYDAHNARIVKRALKKYPRELDDNGLINWWKAQDIIYITSLQSYMFWLWTTKHEIDHSLFESVYDVLTPVISHSWSMPVQITTGLDFPLLDGGFVNREFSIFQYRFSPANHGFLVTCQEHPVPAKTIESFDLVLALLSFLLDKYSYGYLGFQQLHARKSTSTERATIGVGLGPEVRQNMIDFDFEQVEVILSRIVPQKEDDGLSLSELLNIRHRAVLDSSRESKIITLWSAIEAQWGDEDTKDLLLSEEERDEIKQRLSFLPDSKFGKVVDQISKLKNKTRNEKIIDEIHRLGCFDGWNISATIRKIHALRSKFAHGGIMEQKDFDDVHSSISFLMQVVDTLISNKLAFLNLVFNDPTES